jgi:hypothetical protein
MACRDALAFVAAKLNANGLGLCGGSGIGVFGSRVLGGAGANNAGDMLAKALLERFTLGVGRNDKRLDDWHGKGRGSSDSEITHEIPPRCAMRHLVLTVEDDRLVANVLNEYIF